MGYSRKNPNRERRGWEGGGAGDEKNPGTFRFVSLPLEICVNKLCI